MRRIRKNLKYDKVQKDMLLVNNFRIKIFVEFSAIWMKKIQFLRKFLEIIYLNTQMINSIPKILIEKI